jgi:NADH-quinone oxidoreductase subunit F
VDKIIVGTGTCGVSAGADKVLAQFKKLASDTSFELTETGCIGMCYNEVLVEVHKGNNKYLYGHVNPEIAEKIVEEHIKNDKPVTDSLLLENGKGKDDFLNRQERIVLRNCGVIDPNSIDEYTARKGYEALKKVVTGMNQDELIQQVIDSGLRGRGGAGFLTGVKWQFAKKSESDEKYAVCNADEGDPGAFMDRSILEGDPHSVLEGLAICGFAIGAQTGYIYCRAEYPRAIEHLKNAIQQAEEKGFLGKNMFGSDFNFKIKIKEGAGAFVCGEETALLASIEGKRGTPRIRPPYPAVRGLWGKPTNINNVETLANIPWIVLNSPKAFSDKGTPDSRGTKVFAMAGKVKRSGLVEVPMGITINEIIHDVCGGIIDNKEFKAVQMGGPSGGCIPASMGETQIDYQQINKTGAIMGSGGMIAVDENTCMVELARFFLEFTQIESCGKCTNCRVGTLRMLEILNRIVEGKGQDGDIETLEELGNQIKDTSQCGLGQSAPNPVLTTIKYFREEYEKHIKDKRCPAHSCSLLVDYVINEEKCTGCTLCVKDCPSDAITGEKKAVHTIHKDKCIKCGKCITVCAFDAIYKD